MNFNSINLIEFDSNHPLAASILKNAFSKMLTYVIKIGRFKYLDQMNKITNKFGKIFHKKNPKKK